MSDPTPTGQSKIGTGSTLSAPGAFSERSMGKPVVARDSVATEKQPAPSVADTDNDSLKARNEFVNSVHKYIRENVLLADQKAGFIFAASTALLAFLYKSATAIRWMKPVMQWNIIDLSAFIGMLGLAVGSLLAIVVVMPRLPGSRRGYIFWEAIAEYGSAREYSDDLTKLTNSTFCQSVAEHCYDLAKVCRKKYIFLRWAIWFCAIGLCASIVLFLLGLSPPSSSHAP